MDSHPDPRVVKEQFEQVVYVGSSTYDIRGRILSHISKDLTGGKFTSIHLPTEIVEIQMDVNKSKIRQKEGDIAKEYHNPPDVFAFSDEFDP